MHMCDYVYKVHIDNLFLPLSLTQSKIEKDKYIYLFYFLVSLIYWESYQMSSWYSVNILWTGKQVEGKLLTESKRPVGADIVTSGA